MTKYHVKTGQLVYKIIFPLRRIYRSNKTRAYGVVEYEGKILLVKNWLGAGNWSLPGGGAKKGESTEDTLKRELQEEAGLNIDVSMVKILLKGVHNREFGKKKYVIYHVPLNKKPSIIINHLEITDAEWINKKELKNIKPKSHELKEVIKIINT